MQNQKTMAPANIQANEGLETFKQGVDNLLAKRSYFISRVLPQLREGCDYYLIRGKKNLSKGGAEKLVGIYSLVATFQKDEESLEMLGNQKGTVAYVCTFTRFGEVVGQGRGADSVQRNDNDPNKTIKMAQKRAYVDGAIRTVAISDLFTQDLEDTDPKNTNNTVSIKKENKHETWMNDLENETKKSTGYEEYPNSDNLITAKQRQLLIALANQKCEPEEREMLLESINSMEKTEASHVIKELIES